jgi:hypothetical protein
MLIQVPRHTRLVGRISTRFWYGNVYGNTVAKFRWNAVP